MLRRRSSCGERLTATRMGCRPLRRHSRQSAAACFSTHASDGRHQAGGLQQRQEGAGRDKAVLRILPAQQRLDADDPAGAQLIFGW